VFGDDDNKKVFRDQVIGLLLITAIVIGWSYFFIPSPPQKTVKNNGNAAVSEVEKRVSENTAPLQSSEQKSPIEKEDIEKEKKQQLSEMGIIFPPEPEIKNEEDNQVTLSKEDMDIVFTRVGARVKYLNIYLKPNRTDKVQLVPIWKNTPDKDAVYPFGLRFHAHPLDDELDSKLHPNLVCKIVSLFNSKEFNRKNAQLIFNTHDTYLLSSGLFRRDQIWFTNKNKYGEAKLYSLADFKSDVVRKTEPFEDNYIKGKYGAVPFLGFFDNLKLYLTENENEGQKS